MCGIIMLSIYKYNLNFISPVPFYWTKTDKRQGLIFEYKSNGSVYYSDAIVFDALKTESIDKVANYIENADFEQITDVLFAEVDKLNIENVLASAVNSLICDIKMQPTNNLAHVNVNALITSIDNETIVKVNELKNIGYDTFKLKFTGDIRETEVLSRISEIPGIKLRLDANRRFNFCKAVSIFKDIKPEAIDYIEEPLISPTLAKEFTERTGLPMALDETIFENGFDLNDYEACSVFVIKPALIGSFAKFKKLVEYCKTHDKRIVLSSSYESGVGIAFLTRLAEFLQLGDERMGVGYL